MTLTSHGLIGAATASLFATNPIVGLSAAFLSHFAADAIPHWDYQIRSSKKHVLDPLLNDFTVDRNSVIDLLKIGTDFTLGLILSAAVFGVPDEKAFVLIVGGAFFGILPDPLQFAYWKLRREPLTTLQKFHVKIHATQRIYSPWFGIMIQLAIVSIFISFTRILLIL